MTATTRVRVDNTVERPDGTLQLVEAMFSSTVDLTTARGELAARIHPSKAVVFLAALEGAQDLCVRSVQLEGPHRVSSDVEIYVNGPDGLVRRRFEEVATYCRELLAAGTCSGVLGTTVLEGFDPGHEPVLRDLEGGRCLLVFAALPPLTDVPRFDLDGFAGDLVRQIAAPCTHDDREVFAIAAPSTDVHDGLRSFFRNRTVPPIGTWARLLGRFRRGN